MVQSGWLALKDLTVMMQEKLRKPLPIELITLLYTVLTALLIIMLWRGMDEPWRLLGGRAFILLGMGVMRLIYQWKPCQFTLFLRYLYPLTLLGYWYPDTYEFCRLFPNLDHIFAQADLNLFGCQPSIVFSQLVPQKIWSELFYMGYFSYYPLIVGTAIAPLLTCREKFETTAFIILAGFFLYYIIYLFLPVAGPQYYFQAVGTNIISAGHFPALGDYFRYHQELAPSTGQPGFFRDLVEATQAQGERPTAAFPSSHVGMSTILMFLLWRNHRYYALIAAPFYVLLCMATVYIQAHYLIDVIGGLVTALIFYHFTSWLSLRFAYYKDGIARTNFL